MKSVKLGHSNINLTKRQARQLEKLLYRTYTYIFFSTKMNETSMEQCLENEKKLDELWLTVLLLIKAGNGSVGKRIFPWSTSRHIDSAGVKEG